MLANGQFVIQLMEQLAPKHYALPDDPIGLQLGTLNKTVSNVLVALDVTADVVDEAIERGVQLIVAHHAIMFRPMKHIRTDLPAGRLIERLIKHDIAVYISHTNLDVAEGGVNDILAEALGLQELSALQDVHTEKLYKLVVFVPEEHHQRVQQAVFAAGAGQIGNYGSCSFNVEGTGTFTPMAGSDPYIGQQGRFEQVKEIRLETIVPESVRRKTVQAMLKAHPYEEVAYDIYPVDLKGRSFGIGRVGKLGGETTLTELAEHVKRSYDLTHVRMVGDPNRRIRKVAVLGGAGRSFVQSARFAGADVLVTGDIDHHTAHDALADGMAIIDAGHHIEKLLKPAVAAWLNERLATAGYTTAAAASQVSTDPFRLV